MKSLSQLKYSLSFNESLDQIINILKIATSIQLRQFQRQQWGEERFPREIYSVLSKLGQEKITIHPLLLREQETPQTIVVITSDEGFLGDLNMLLISAALRQKKTPEDSYIVLGDKGSHYFRGKKESFRFLPGVKEKTFLSEARKLKKFLIRDYLDGKINKAIIVYAEFISVTAREIKTRQLLPFPMSELEGKVRKKTKEAIITEPSDQSIIEGLIGLYLESSLGQILYSSKLAELAARLMHLEASYQELTRINRKLAREYFKSVHALADKRIRELFAARIKVKK
ncbi:MAG: F0F1 ATP synthase subunit gamma [PVC group bacterium]|nr:F0F1 ATP synthase subunit gamma [PVC group bacterium]